MAATFNIRLLTNATTCDAVYATYKNGTNANYDATLHAKTMYILQNGKGYLGNQVLFDAGKEHNLVTALTDSTSETDAGASAKAIVDYVTAKVTGLADGANKFFSTAESYVLTAADLIDSNFNTGASVAGARGIKFTLDNDNDNTNGASYLFVPITITVSDITTVIEGMTQNSNTIETKTVGSNKVLEAKIKTGEQNLAVDTTNGGLYVNPIGAFGASGDDNRIPNVAAIRAYLTQALNTALANVVTYNEEE